jgi:hypothetical protein
MTWEFYEVWGVDEDGHEELIDTAKELKRAQELADENLNSEDSVLVECIIFREDANGDLEEIERLTFE